MTRADAQDGVHGDERVDRLGEVDGDAVTRLHPELDQHARRARAT